MEDKMVWCAVGKYDKPVEKHFIVVSGKNVLAGSGGAPSLYPSEHDAMAAACADACNRGGSRIIYEAKHLVTAGARARLVGLEKGEDAED